MEILFCFYLAVLGFIFGSFIDCAASRNDIPMGRSKCDTCKHELNVIDLVPIFSFIFNKGKCRYCGAKIPLECLIVELFCGFMFAFLGWHFSFSVELLMWLILSALLLALSLVDFKTFTVPDKILIAMAINRIIFAFILKSSVLDMLIGAVSISMPLLIIVLIMEHFLQKEAMGGGDIKLLFVIGLYMTPIQMLLTIFLASFIALFYIFITKNQKIPFAPFISFAWFLVLLFGDSFINWYLNLITF